jgi:hypothetical protein
MSEITTVFIASLTAAITLILRYIVTRATHRGSVKASDAETIFKASEEIRNDMAKELVACRKERDHYIDRFNDCMEEKNHDRH